MSGREQPRPRLFGVVLAGGRSRRYGSSKARARLAGRTLLERALAILGAAGLETGVIANRADDLPWPWRDEARAKGRGDAKPSGGGQSPPAARAGPPVRAAPARPSVRATPAVPVRPDLTPGAGPLGGLRAALSWARERGDAGVFLLGCDLPLVPPALVELLVHRFDAARPTVPASPGPLGTEPLCACYPVGLLSAIVEWLAAGRFGMGEFVRAHNPVVVTHAQLAAIADPEHAFLNVNTPADRDRAARLLTSRPPEPSRG